MWDSVGNRDVGWWTVPVGSSLSLQHPVFQLRDATLAPCLEEQGWDSGEEDEACYGWESEEEQEACTESKEGSGSTRLQIRDLTLAPCTEEQEVKSWEEQESSGDQQIDICEDHMAVMQKEEDRRVVCDEKDKFSLVSIHDSRELEMSREIEKATESSGSKEGCEVISTKKMRLGKVHKCKCAGCLLPPCGSCRFCKDSAKFKGPNKLHQRCQLRKCHVGGVKRRRRQTRCLPSDQDSVPMDQDCSNEVISGDKFEIKKCYVVLENSEEVQKAIEDQVKIVKNLRMRGLVLRNIGSGDICDICGKKTKTTGGVYSHKKIYHYMEGLMCNICGRRNMQYGNYRTHMKTHNPFKSM